MSPKLSELFYRQNGGISDFERLVEIAVPGYEVIGA
jgi:hypothetical protein